MWLRFQSQTRPSPATTATGHASPASALSATSVPAGDVDDPLLNLRSRSHAMMMIVFYETILAVKVEPNLLVLFFSEKFDLYAGICGTIPKFSSAV